MLSYDNVIEIIGPKSEIDFIIASLIFNDMIESPDQEYIDDFIDVRQDGNLWRIRISNLDTSEPPIETVRTIGNSLMESHVKLEYISENNWHAGVLEIKECLVLKEEEIRYKCAQDLQEFADRVGHLHADVAAFSMRDAFCYMENEEMHKYQTRDGEGSLQYFRYLKEAFEAAESDPSIWKISWDDGEDRIRMVREGNAWKYEPFKRSA